MSAVPIARVTTQLRYDSKFIAALKEVDCRADRPTFTEYPKMERLAAWLRDVERLIEKMNEWKVESAFSGALNTVLPALEKDIGLLVLRVAGADDALVRWMWTKSLPPASGVRPLSEG